MDILKRVFFITVSSITLSAATLDINIYGKLYNTLFPKLFNKDIIKLYITNKAYTKLFKNTPNIIIVQKCEEADLIFGNKELKCKKWRFVLDYKVYKEGKNILGAFYWRKGRPQLRIKQESILKILPKIPKEVERYVF